MVRTLQPGLLSWLLSVLFATSALMPLAACAVEATPLSADPALELKVMRVAEELRCLVCQNETIAASNADLAVDLRRQIRLKLQQGQSEAQILDFMVERYGAFVRYRPAFDAKTALLWLGPFVLLVIAAVVMVQNIRKRRAAIGSAASAPLSASEAQRATELLSREPVQP